MFRRGMFPLIDLRLFDENPEPVSAAQAPAPEPALADAPPTEPPSLDEPSPDGELDLLSPDILINRVLGQKVPPLPAPKTETAPEAAVQSSSAGSTPPAPQAAPSQGAPIQAPAQSPVVGIPADLLTVLGRLATKALPEPAAPVSPPEPELPPLPEPPEILKGSPDEQEQKYMENPLAFNRAMMQHELATQRVQAERDRITAEHKTKVATGEKTEAFKQGFLKQVQTLGTDVFERRAPLAEQAMKDMPYLLQLPPEQAVEAAFRFVAEREQPKAIDPMALTQEQRVAVKAALRDEVIKEYLAGVTSGKTPPQVINGGAGAGKTPLTPGNSPTDLDEAEASFLRRRGVPR